MNPTELEDLYDRLSVLGNVSQSDMSSALRKDRKGNTIRGESSGIVDLSKALAKPNEIRTEIGNANNFVTLKKIREDKIPDLLIQKNDIEKEEQSKKLEIIDNLRKARVESKDIQRGNLRDFALGNNPSDVGELTATDVRQSKFTRVNTLGNFYGLSEEETRNRLDELGIEVNEDGKINK